MAFLELDLRLKRPTFKGELAYEAIALEGSWKSSVEFLWQGERLRFSGELQRKKSLAEHAAARNALDYLKSMRKAATWAVTQLFSAI